MFRTGAFKETSIAARVAQQKQTVSRWALQWRSIILSSLGKTTYPYCLYIQSLDLRNLEDLLEENIFREHFQAAFFGGDMAPFSSTRETPMITRTRVKRQKQLPRMNIAAVINAVGESISKFVADSASLSGTTAALEDLSVNIRSDALPRWIERLSRLESMTLWDGAILDGYVGEIIKTHCRNFNSLNVYTCLGDQVDLNLAGFLSAMSSNTLRSLRVFSHNDIGEETFQALNQHHESLIDLVLGNIKSSAVKALPSLQGLTALRNLDLHDAESLINLEATKNERFSSIINWVTSCQQLETIRLHDFLDGPAIMKALCLKDDIHLNAVTVSGYTLVNNQDFHQSLAHQTTLESLELRADAEESARDDIDILVSSLCSLKGLRYLNILDTSDYFQTLQIQQLALSLPMVRASYLHLLCLRTTSICCSALYLTHYRFCMFMSFPLGSAGLLSSHLYANLVVLKC
jgi:hypothetical protein